MDKFQYLKQIQTDISFKRQNVSTIRYPGGKSKAIGHIVQYLPDKLPKRIVSPFCGGASLEIAIANNLNVDEVIMCDIFNPLVNFWKVQLSKPKELADAIEPMILTIEAFNEYKEKLRHWYEDKIILSDIESAALFYYNFSTTYGPYFLGWPSKNAFSGESSRKGFLRGVERVRTFSAPKLTIEYRDFENTLNTYSNDFLYLDPPYLLGYDSGVFKAIYPDQNGRYHINFDHIKLRDMLKSRNSEWIMSYNDCGTIKEWYKEYEHQFPKWAYTYQQGETRKDKIKGGKDSKKESKEILIINTKYSKFEKSNFSSDKELFIF